MTQTLPFGDDILVRIGGRLGELGLELCHADWKPSKRSVLALTIDREGGVSLHDCEIASRAVSDILDPIESLPDYSLEVASPGLDRALYSIRDCVRFAGRRVSVRLKTSVEGTARLRGILEKVDGDTLTVLDEDRRRHYTVRFGDVRLARLVPDL